MWKELLNNFINGVVCIWGIIQFILYYICKGLEIILILIILLAPAIIIVLSTYFSTWILFGLIPALPITIITMGIIQQHWDL